MGQYIFVWLSAMVLLRITGQGNDICETFLRNEEEFLQLLLPLFCITLTITSGSITGYGYYQLTLLVLYYMQLLLHYIFFPLIQLYVAFVILNGIGRQKRFEQAQKLC